MMTFQSILKILLQNLITRIINIFSKKFNKTSIFKKKFPNNNTCSKNKAKLKIMILINLSKTKLDKKKNISHKNNRLYTKNKIS